MEAQLRQLLKMCDEVIPALVENYNLDTQEFNQLNDDHVALGKERDALQQTVTELTELVKKQQAKMNELLNDLKEVTHKSTSTITQLESELSTVKSDLKAFRALNPKKLEKTNKEQKARLAELNKKIARLEGELRNERRESKRVKQRLEDQKLGVWMHGQERIIPFLHADVIQRDDITTDSTVKIGAWWHHECGMQIICSYDQENDEIYMCNPYDESGALREPSVTAQNQLLKQFRAEAKKQ